MAFDLLSYLDVGGPLFSYLGHFRQLKILECGHNDSSGEDDAAQVDKFLEGMGSSRMTSTAQDEPGGA